MSNTAASEDERMVTLTLTDKTAEQIIRALQLMATAPTEPQYEREAYKAALTEFGEALRVRDV